MKKIILYIATSANGYIADSEGGVKWLEEIPNPENSDYGYYEFYETIDTTIMGAKTYLQVKSFDIPFPYKDKNNFVFTNRDLPIDEDVEFVRKDHLQFTENLKKQSGKHIWLVGGGQLNSFFLRNGLIDEIHQHIMPIILPAGIPLFPGMEDAHQFDLISSKSYSSGVIECKYSTK